MKVSSAAFSLRLPGPWNLQLSSTGDWDFQLSSARASISPAVIKLSVINSEVMFV